MNEIMSEGVEKGGKKRRMKRVIVMKGRRKSYYHLLHNHVVFSRPVILITI